MNGDNQPVGRPSGESLAMTSPINSVSDDDLKELLAYEGDLYLSRAAQPYLRRLLTELLSRRAANSAGGVGVKAAVEAEPLAFDPERALKDTLFQFVKAGITRPISYGGVLVADGKFARIRFDTDHPASPVSAEVTVDDAMVERALRRWFGESWPNAVPGDLDGVFDDMRATLLATLNGGRENG